MQGWAKLNTRWRGRELDHAADVKERRQEAWRPGGQWTGRTGALQEAREGLPLGPACPCAFSYRNRDPARDHPAQPALLAV